MSNGIGKEQSPPLPKEVVDAVKADLLANIPVNQRPLILSEDIQRAWRTIYWEFARAALGEGK
jgi:hypothetical protein